MSMRQQSAIVRATNALVRGLGGTSVSLRVPGDGAAGSERELGLAPGAYQEIELSPVVVRSLETKDGRERIQVLVPMAALEKVISGFGANTPREFLHTALAVVWGERVFQITETSTESFGGLQYMWRITATG
jgi:hypothetical protein